MKTLIAVPCFDMVHTDFMSSLMALQRTEDTSFTVVKNTLIHVARGVIANNAIEAGFDRVMWFDSDMVFEPDTLERMMKVLDEHPEIDILSGLYFRRGHPFTPVLFSKLEVNEKNELEFNGYDDVPDGLFEVAGCGFGCVLMRTECLMDIAAKEGGGVWFSPLVNAGEDCAFCIRARREGYRIFCDPSVQLGHMGYAPITRAFYEATKREAK